MCAGAALVEMKTDGGQDAKTEILGYIFYLPRLCVNALCASPDSMTHYTPWMIFSEGSIPSLIPRRFTDLLGSHVWLQRVGPSGFSFVVRLF